MKRVVIDARELFGHPTGVGRFLRELLTRWASAPYAAGTECLLLTHRDPADAPSIPSAAGCTLRWKHVAGSGGTSWEQGPLRRAVNHADAQVLLSPAYSTPLLARIPAVLALHDVSFAARPEWFGRREGVRRRVLARWSARKAAAIVTLTQFSAREIIARLGVAPERIHVVPLAVDYAHQTLPQRQASDESLPRVLFVGSIFERRHLPQLMEGVALARADVPALTLQVIGENRTSPRLDLARRATTLGIAEATRLRGYVSDDELARAYSESTVFAFLSEYEGFGLPPLEAMQAGLATLVLDTAVAREVYRDGVHYAPLGDSAAVARALVQLSTDDADRDALIARGRAVAASYQWAHTAERVWQVLTSAARRS